MRLAVSVGFLTSTNDDNIKYLLHQMEVMGLARNEYSRDQKSETDEINQTVQIISFAISRDNSVEMP